MKKTPTMAMTNDSVEVFLSKLGDPDKTGNHESLHNYCVENISDAVDGHEILERKELSQIILAILTRYFPEREKEIICACFEFPIIVREGAPGIIYTMENIEERYSLKRQSIYQIKVKVVNRLRKEFRRQLFPYVA